MDTNLIEKKTPISVEKYSYNYFFSLALSVLFSEMASEREKKVIFSLIVKRYT